MNGYLLDTDILISFLRGKNEKLKKDIHAILEKRFYIGFSVFHTLPSKRAGMGREF